MLELHVASEVCVSAGNVVALAFGDNRATLQFLRATFVLDLLNVAGPLGRLRHPLRRASHVSREKINCGKKVPT